MDNLRRKNMLLWNYITARIQHYFVFAHSWITAQFDYPNEAPPVYFCPRLLSQLDSCEKQRDRQCLRTNKHTLSQCVCGLSGVVYRADKTISDTICPGKIWNTCHPSVWGWTLDVPAVTVLQFKLNTTLVRNSIFV